MTGSTDSTGAIISCCGLYCTNCPSFKRGRCTGCPDHPKAGWCKVRACCMEHGWTSCADCTLLDDPATCGKLDNFMSRFFSFLFRTDRLTCIRYIRAHGYDEFARRMEENGRVAFKRGDTTADI